VQIPAAVLWGVGEKWKVEPVVLAEPRLGEVLVKVVATGLCHSDDHAVTGDMPFGYPIIGGHEGAGIVEAVGPGVSRVRPGDHVVLAFNLPCGRCRYCARGQSNLCALAVPDRPAEPEPSPFQARGRETAAMGGLGTFSPYTVVKEGCVIRIDDDISFEVGALLGCAVTTGWGAAVYLAEVRPGDNVVVIGSGGVGVNSVQGARNAGADVILAIDTNEFKREQALRFGATHTAASLDEGRELIAGLTGGRMADAVILSIGVGSGDVIGPMMSTIGLAGRAVITSVTPFAAATIEMNLFEFTLSQKTLRGNVYGGVNVYRDVPLLLDLYRRGKLLLDELVTARYALDDINQGYADMHAGKNLRGVVLHDS
jgi:S-(hydroxymethyl)glutathione dehydrogenase/alcohol dehydrogenase